MPKEQIPSPGGMNFLKRLIAKLKSGMGIVEDTDVATNTIAAGKYVTWKGTLCKAKTAIPSGTALSSSNLEVVSEGGFNEISSKIATKENVGLTVNSSYSSYITNFSNLCKITNNAFYFGFAFTANATIPAGEKVLFTEDWLFSTDQRICGPIINASSTTIIGAFYIAGANVYVNFTQDVSANIAVVASGSYTLA